MPGTTTQHFPFLRLPLELREAVYSHYFDPATHLIACEGGTGKSSYRFDFNIYLASSQIYREAQKVFRRELSFIRVETPWPETGGLDLHIRLQPAVARNIYCNFLVTFFPSLTAVQIT